MESRQQRRLGVHPWGNGNFDAADIISNSEEIAAISSTIVFTLHSRLTQAQKRTMLTYLENLADPHEAPGDDRFRFRNDRGARCDVLVGI